MLSVSRRVKYNPALRVSGNNVGDTIEERCVVLEKIISDYNR